MSRRLLALSALCLLLACDSETAEAQSGDPAQVTYAEALGVDLAAMQRRESGLYVQDLAVGEGAEAVTGKAVTVHYAGWLPDGTLFDTSRTRSTPFTFRLGQGDVIAGWDEGVQGMRVGGKRRLVLPAELGYGARGAGGVIPPNAVLVFDVELLAVQ